MESKSEANMNKVLAILLSLACWSSQSFAEFNPPEPPMTWSPAHSTNYLPANRTAEDISRIVVHITCTTETSTCNGTLASAVSWFGQQHFPPDDPTSAHFVVGPEDSNIVHMVEEKDIAYHAKSYTNPSSIGIEHAGFGDIETSTTDVQHQTSARLARWLCSV